MDAQALDSIHTSRTRQNVQIVKDAYDAIARGDLPALLRTIADDVQIHVPGPAAIPFAGIYRGHEGVSRFAQHLVESIDWDTRQFRPREFIAEGDQVAVLGDERLTSKVTGRMWETEWAMAWTLRDGKIALLREFHQTDAIADAFAD